MHHVILPITVVLVAFAKLKGSIPAGEMAILPLAGNLATVNKGVGSFTVDGVIFPLTCIFVAIRKGCSPKSIASIVLLGSLILSATGEGQFALAIPLVRNELSRVSRSVRENDFALISLGE